MSNLGASLLQVALLPSSRSHTDCQACSDSTAHAKHSRGITETMSIGTRVKYVYNQPCAGSSDLSEGGFAGKRDAVRVSWMGDRRSSLCVASSSLTYLTFMCS